MSTPSTGVTMSMDVPPDQNTAPVHEFRCLWTPDTRRKQKRWQDGRLKFHTFNRRVMVYDDRSNFVGDTHWREKTALDEGKELELERGGILVQVTEYIERKNQDLSQLIDKRIKEREGRFSAKHDSSPARPPDSASRSQGIAAAHLKPKPLNAILGTPSGHYGKALVTNVSPFEQRQVANGRVLDENENSRSTKRRKLNDSPPSKNGFAQNLLGASLSFSSRPSSTGPIRKQPLKLKSIQRPTDVDSREGNVDEGKSLTKISQLPDQNSKYGQPVSRRMQARKKEKIIRSGYASNLTGAPLSLSSSMPRNTDRSSTLKRSPTITIDLSMDSSSDEHDGMAVDSARIPESMSKHKEIARPREHRQKPSVCTNRRSENVVRSASDATSLKTSNQNKTQRNTPSISKQEPEKPHSSLRIRSRPRAKKMMFLDQPSSRAASFSAQQGSSRSDEDMEALDEVDTSFLSHDTSPPVETRQKDPVLSRPTEFHDDGLSLSPLQNISIDHHTIDEILSRNRPPEQQQPKSIRKSLKQQVADVAPISSVDAEKKVKKTSVVTLRLENTDIPADDVVQKLPQRLVVHSKAEAPTVDQRKTGHDADQRPVSLIEADKHVQNVPAEASAPITANNSPSRTEKSRDHVWDVASRANVTEWLDDATSNNSTTSAHTAKSFTGIGGAIETAHPELASINIGQPSTVANGFDGPTTTFIATPRFMANLTPQTKQHHNEAIPSELACGSSNPRECSTSPPQKHPSGGVVDKQSPSSRPLILETDHSRPAFVSANEIAEMDKKSKSMEASNIAERGLFRSRITNPATRGLSIQATAKRTLQTLATAVNVMAPPAPLEKLGRVAANNDNAIGTENDKGPWSRESFDLFGSWRPPVQP